MERDAIGNFLVIKEFKMIPVTLADNLANLIPTKPEERLNFWVGFKAGVAATNTHARTELTAMADLEVKHAEMALTASEMRLPRRPSNN